MISERTAETIFHAARAKTDPAERAGFLDGACGGDAELRAKVEELLLADAEAGSFLQSGAPASTHQPAQGVDPDATVAQSRNAQQRDREARHFETAGQMIGRYKLLQPIGEGGFGSVWMAEQREPVKRRVALKIIKLGMDTRQVIARFEAERQALAMMDHPHIARVLDAGSTEAGRPYFVMEYIKGVPILEYCDTAKLDTKARLRLFVSVCQAIQHAHQKGIIHRDIKPSNVLVTMHDGVPVPKIIDFGIAKATSSELTQKTLFTEHRQMIGTPAYMSPEQAEMSGLDIDTRSDIYSLGVLLYELLTGTTPFATEELVSKGFAEMMRIIREVEPHKPSTRLSSLGEIGTRTAQQRHADDAKKLVRILRGELDWIVMKCLEKDRTRRYETANGLAADIRRHLNDEPVMAGPPSGLYRLRKLARRHRVALATGGLVAVVMLVASIVSVIFGVSAVRARSHLQAAKITLEQSFEKEREAGAALAAANAELARQRDEAQRQGRLSRDVLSYVTSDLIAAVHPNRLGREATVRDWLVAASRSLTASDENAPFAEEPEARIALDRAIGTAFQELDYADASRPHLERALEDATKRYGRSSIETLLVMEPLVRARFALLDIEPATDLSKEALALCRAHHADNAALLIDLLNDYGAIEYFSWDSQGQRSAIERVFNANLEAARLAERSNDAGRLVSSLKNLSRSRYYVGQQEESRAAAERAFDVATKAFGPNSVRTLEALHELALSKQRFGALADSISILKELAARSREVLGEHSQLFLMATRDIAMVQSWHGDSAASLESWETAIQYRTKALGPDHTWTLGARIDRTNTLRYSGKLDEARAELLAVVVTARRAYGDQHGFTAEAAQALASFLTGIGSDAEALPFYAESSRATQAAALYSGLVGPRIRAHADCLQRLGRPGEAIEVLRVGLGDDRSIITKRLDMRPVARDLIARLNALGQPERDAAAAEAAAWTAALGDWRTLVELPNISIAEMIGIARELLTASPESARNPEAAAALLDRALANAGDRVELWERASDVYELGGMVDREFALRRRMVERADATADQLQKFSRRLRSVTGEQQDLRESLRLAERAVALAPAPDVLYNLGEAQEAGGLRHQAMESFKQAASHPDAPTWQRESYAWRLLVSPDPALRDAAEALLYAQLAQDASLGKPSLNALHTLAMAEMANSLPNDAAATWDRLAARAHERPDAIDSWARELLTISAPSLRNPKFAVRLAEGLVARENPQILHLGTLALAQQAAGQPADATWQRILNYPNVNLSSLNDLAWRLLTDPSSELRAPTQARLIAERVVAHTVPSDRQLGGFLDTLALALFENNDVEGAVEQQRRAVELMEDPRSSFHGEVKQARERLRRFEAAAAAAHNTPDSGRPEQQTPAGEGGGR